MSIQVVINGLSLVMYGRNKGNYLVQPSGVMLGAQVVLLLFSLAAGTLVGQLSVFHIWLKYNNLSTFELIKMHRELEEEEKKADADTGK